MGIWRCELDIKIGRIAQKMCLQIGRDATYIFFGKLKSFIDGTLKDTALYDKIFKHTFSDAIRDRTIDLTKIEGQIMSHVQSRLGGSSPIEKPAYWKQYAENMYQQNQAYLNGLVKATKGASEQFKKANDKIGVVEKVVKHGIRDAPKEIIEDAMTSGGAIPSIVVEKLMEVAVNVIQMKLLKQASSRVFTEQQSRENLSQLEAAIIKKNGECGDPVPAVEDEDEYLNPPRFWGTEDFIVPRRRRIR
jgi:hypothetical protein